MFFFKADALADNGQLDEALRFAENAISNGQCDEAEILVQLRNPMNHFLMRDI